MGKQRRPVFRVRFTDAGGGVREELWWRRRHADRRVDELAAAGIHARVRTTRTHEPRVVLFAGMGRGPHAAVGVGIHGGHHHAT